MTFGQGQEELEEETPSTKRRRLDKSGHKVGFGTEWQRDRPWLQHSTEETEDGSVSVILCLMCLMCRKFNSTGLNRSRKWVDIGCRSLRLDKVKEHENSSQHKNAVVASLTETLDEVTDKIDDATYNVTDATKVLQFLLTKNLPLSLFGELTDLCIAVGSKSLQPTPSQECYVHQRRHSERAPDAIPQRSRQK